MKKSVFVCFLAVFFLISCTGNPAAKQDPNLPPWIHEIAPDEVIWGIGSAKLARDNDSMNEAEQRAQLSIGNQLNVHVRGMFTDYNRAVGMSGNQDTASLQETVSRSVSETRLSESTVNRRWKAPDGTWWIRVEYKKSEAREMLAGIISNESAGFAEFKLEEALKLLDALLEASGVGETDTADVITETSENRVSERTGGRRRGDRDRERNRDTVSQTEITSAPTGTATRFTNTGFYTDGVYQGDMGLTEILNWINRNITDGGNYDIVLGQDIRASNISFNFNSDVTITLRSDGLQRTISYDTENPINSLFTVGRNTTLVLEDSVVLLGLENNSRPMVNVNGGTFIMNGGEIKENRVRVVTGGTNTGGVYITSGNFIMNNGVISENSSSSSDSDSTSGGGVYVGNGASFTMNNGNIRRNFSNGRGGGGVLVAAGGTFTMNNGIINENIGSSGYWSGGGVYVRGGIFTMYDGTINGNNGNSRIISGGSGGGVFVGGEGGTFIMNGGIIRGNINNSTGDGGGGVFVGTNRENTFTMNDGIISGNSSIGGGGGGGVCIRGGIFTMNNGTISGNIGSSSGGRWSGGGVFIREGTFIKSANGGIIYGLDTSERLANKATGQIQGQAVFIQTTTIDVFLQRNMTAGVNQALDSRQRGTTGGWE